MTKPRAAATKDGPALASAGDIEAIVAGAHGDPFAVLGVQEAPGGGLVARCFVPHAETVSAFTLDGKRGRRAGAPPRWRLLRGQLTIRKRQPLRYHARNAGGDWWLTDPYSFGPVLGPMDDYYIAEGSHLRLFDKMGAHPLDHEGATASISPSGRRTPGASRSSATSTTGTAGAM